MKKTLLIAAAALAAGIISSQAQTPVYSQNIVGYANIALPNGYALTSNPFDVVDGTGAVNNSATNVFPNVYNAGIGGGPLDGNELFVWNGGGYTTYYFDGNPADYPAGQFTGFTDQSGNPLTPPVLGAGVGFYFQNTSGAVMTNTIVGSVRGATSTGVSNNVVIPAAQFNLIASATPLGGTPVTNLFLPNIYDAGIGGGPLDGCIIQIPNYNVSGALVSYTSYYMDCNPADYPAGQFTGFTDQNGNPLPAPNLSTGSGFFFQNVTGAAISWTQQLTF